MKGFFTVEPRHLYVEKDQFREPPEVLAGFQEGAGFVAIIHMDDVKIEWSFRERVL
jgi:hypothetical protein